MAIGTASSPAHDAHGAASPSHRHGHAEWKDYRHLNPRYRTSVEALRSLARARLMSEHRRPSEHLDLEIALDSPFMQIKGRDNVRVAEYAVKWILADVEIKPMMYKVRELDDKRTRLELLLQVHLSPHRPWWLPATWLLPREVTLEADFHLRISRGAAPDGSNDVITAMEGSLPNLGKLPLPARILLGAALGYLPAATETFWSPFVGLLGDPSYRQEAAAEAEARGGAGAGLLGKAKAAASNLVDKAQETVAAATGIGGAEVGGGGAMGVLSTTAARAADQAQVAAASAAGTTAAAAEKTAGAADSAAQKVGNGGVKGKAVEAVRDAVQDVAGAVKGGAVAGAEKVAEVAGRAKKGVTGHA